MHIHGAHCTILKKFRFLSRHSVIWQREAEIKIHHLNGQQKMITYRRLRFVYAGEKKKAHAMGMDYSQTF